MIRVNIIKDDRIISSVSDVQGENILMAWAQENEKNSGFCIFSETGEIIRVKDNDDVFELLIRASLNYLDLNGVRKGFCENADLYENLKKLGFRETVRGVEVEIADFFKPCCHKG